MKADFLSHVAVLGAFGKMGSGISLLALTAIAEQELALFNTLGNFRLYLVDVNDSTYAEILTKIRKHLTQHAEKIIQNLRQHYSKRADLVENHQIIEEFVNGAISCIRVVTDVSTIKKCDIVFEAASENIEIKTKLFTALKSSCVTPPYFLTNTSSIPIAVLANKTSLERRVIGYHFYNPPQKQKLVELVIPEQTEPELKEIAETLGKVMKKIAVPSNDIAGFIGNGHFMREILYAGDLVTNNKTTIPVLDSITRDLLCRPMGIFQLIDYVGLDVCQSILKVMSLYLKIELNCPLINEMLALNVKGGQNPDGSQKNGFFQYEKHKICGFYSIKEKAYIALPDFEIKKILLSIFDKALSWKEAIALTDPNKDEYFKKYFKALSSSSDANAKIAIAYLTESRRIAIQLHKDGVAKSTDDVNRVLQLGFQHAYGPVNTYY